MSLVQRLDLRQAQTLVMTPQLQQAIKLLQLNNLEIGEFVAQEMQQNPLLEESRETDQDRPMDNAEASQDRVETIASSDGGPATTDMEAAQFDAGGLADQARDVMDGVEVTGDRDMPAGSDSAMSFGAGGSGGNFDGELTDFTERMSQELTLRDHLLEQLNTEFDDPKERLIGAVIIEFLEPSGYLADGDSVVRTVATMLGVEDAAVESVLKGMQQFDPPGILARNLAECLAIQLRQLNRFDPAM